MVHGGASRQARLLGAAEALLCRPAPIAGHLRAHLASRGEHAEGLDVTGALAQAAVLVEVAAHELQRAVVVRVQDRRAGLVDLDPAGLQHVGAEGLILGVGDLAKADLLPAGARVAGVDVRQEGGAALSLVDRDVNRIPRCAIFVRAAPPIAVGWVSLEPREELRQLAGDHRARVGPG